MIDFNAKQKSIIASTKSLMELSYGKKSKMKQAVLKNSQPLLNKLRNNIWKYSKEASNELINVLEDMTKINSKIPRKYKNMTLSDVNEILDFYGSCQNCYTEKDYRKVARLELDTDLIDFYLDKRLVASLVRYDELSYANT